MSRVVIILFIIQAAMTRYEGEWCGVLVAGGAPSTPSGPCQSTLEEGIIPPNSEVYPVFTLLHLG